MSIERWHEIRFTSCVQGGVFNSENLKTAKLSQKWVFSDLQLVNLKKKLGNFFLIGIHSMQGWKATTRPELQEKEPQKD